MKHTLIISGILIVFWFFIAPIVLVTIMTLIAEGNLNQLTQGRIIDFYEIWILDAYILPIIFIIFGIARWRYMEKYQLH